MEVLTQPWKSFIPQQLLPRGYNCLALERPGQGRVIRKQKLPFRYDWEKVVKPVIDYLSNLPTKLHYNIIRI